MLMQVSLWARRADDWLQDKLGRPYNVLLGVGLVTEIVRGLSEVPHRLSHWRGFVALFLSLAMQIALLIHQVGALSHHMERRRRRKAEG